MSGMFFWDTLYVLKCRGTDRAAEGLEWVESGDGCFPAQYGDGLLRRGTEKLIFLDGNSARLY